LKLKYDKLLSSFAFKFNLRHYDVEKSGHVLDVGFFFDTAAAGSVDVALTYRQGLPC